MAQNQWKNNPQFSYPDFTFSLCRNIYMVSLPYYISVRKKERESIADQNPALKISTTDINFTFPSQDIWASNLLQSKSPCVLLTWPSLPLNWIKLFLRMSNSCLRYIDKLILMVLNYSSVEQINYFLLTRP